MCGERQLKNPATVNRSHMDNFQELIEIINYKFKNIEILDQAMTHRSYSFEFSNGAVDNERLEFLGDSIIGLCISNEIYHRYPDYPEGKLTLIKSYLASKKFLAELANTIQLGKFIKLGTGEEKTGGRNRITLLANAFEALTGAIFIDGGYSCSCEFLNQFLQPKLDNIGDHVNFQNFKNLLQIHFQKEYGKLPHYIIQEESGPQHEKIYTIAVLFDDNILGTGSDSSKKKASQKAAENALNNLDIL